MVYQRKAPLDQGCKNTTASSLAAYFINHAKEVLGDSPLQTPMYEALDTLKRHSERIVRRITSDLTNARLEGMNSLFQAARARARGYRNTKNFINMIYLIGSPIKVQVQSGKST